MSSRHDVQSYSDAAITGEQPSFADALERVVEAEQELVVRRVDLFLEQVVARAKSLVATSIGAILGVIAALVGWFIAIFGVIDALDDYYAHSAVQIAIGMLHVGAGAAFTLFRLRRRAPGEVPS